MFFLFCFVFNLEDSFINHEKLAIGKKQRKIKQK